VFSRFTARFSSSTSESFPSSPSPEARFRDPRVRPMPPPARSSSPWSPSDRDAELGRSACGARDALDAPRVPRGFRKPHARLRRARAASSGSRGSAGLERWEPRRDFERGFVLTFERNTGSGFRGKSVGGALRPAQGEHHGQDDREEARRQEDAFRHDERRLREGRQRREGEQGRETSR
jgi:hypothetical protein